MTKPFALDLVYNSVSFGSVSTAITREIFKRGLTPDIFPIGGQVDLSAQKNDDLFNKQLQASINDAQKHHSRKHPAFRLWHIAGSFQSYSATASHFFPFHELDGLTPSEVNILKSQDKVYASSRYTQSVFGQYGIQSEYLPLGFDSHNFAPLARRPKIDGVTSFYMGGKLEERKSHPQMIRAWVRKYGNNQKYRLNLAIHNPFLPPDRFNAMIGQILEGKTYSNVNFIPWTATNAEYNAVLQSSDIILCCSRAEGRDLPAYHATALGAWPVALRAHAYLDYLTDDNAILISPNGKAPAADGVFFGQNGPFNSGNWFTWSDDDFTAAMEVAEKRAATGLNVEGMKLQQLTYKDTVDVILKNLA